MKKPSEEEEGREEGRKEEAGRKPVRRM